MCSIKLKLHFWIICDYWLEIALLKMFHQGLSDSSIPVFKDKTDKILYQMKDGNKGNEYTCL